MEYFHFEQIFFPPNQWGSVWDLTNIDPVASEETSFEDLDDEQRTKDKSKWY